MLTLSKRVEYGLIALMHMSALRGGDVAAAKTIAEECRIPVDLLGKVLQGLARGGLVESTAGARGGYRLSRPLDQLTLGAVIEALEGPVQLAKCQQGVRQCQIFDTCTIRSPVARLRAQVAQFVNGVSLSALRPSADSPTEPASRKEEHP